MIRVVLILFLVMPALTFAQTSWRAMVGVPAMAELAHIDTTLTGSPVDVRPEPVRGFIFLPKEWASSTILVTDANDVDVMHGRTDSRGAFDLRKLDKGRYYLWSLHSEVGIGIQVAH